MGWVSSGRRARCSAASPTTWRSTAPTAAVGRPVPTRCSARTTAGASWRRSWTRSKRPAWMWWPWSTRAACASCGPACGPGDPRYGSGTWPSWSRRRQPAGQIGGKPAEVGAGAAVADMAVGPHQILRRPAAPKPAQQPTLGVMQRLAAVDAGGLRAISGQVAHRDQVAIWRDRGSDRCDIPAVGRTGQQQVQPRAGQCVVQPARLVAPLDRPVRHPVAGVRSGTRPGAALHAERAAPGSDTEPGDDPKPKAPDRPNPAGEWDQARYQPGPYQAGHRAGAQGHPERRIGQPQHEPGDRLPLGLVAVQQLRIGTTKDERELPAQIPRILDAGVHFLTAGWAVYVRGISGQA